MMDLKNKLRAIVVNNCDTEIKIELLEELIMHVSNDYMHWFAERDELLINALGLSFFANDDFPMTRENLWERFKEYHKIKA